jgi:curved DNA-binding protein CbpA
MISELHEMADYYHKRAVKQYHPDVTGNTQEAHNRMAQINAAYDRIKRILKYREKEGRG